MCIKAGLKQGELQVAVCVGHSCSVKCAIVSWQKLNMLHGWLRESAKLPRSKIMWHTP